MISEFIVRSLKRGKTKLTQLGSSEPEVLEYLSKLQISEKYLIPGCLLIVDGVTRGCARYVKFR